MLKMNATYFRTAAEVQFVTFESEQFDTIEEAEAFVARFPKSTKMQAIRLGHWVKGGDNTFTYYGRAQIKLLADAANGGINETGVKRYHSIIRNAAKLGETVEYTTPWFNSYPTREAFEAAIA